MVVVAQLVRAPDCGSGGRRFETDLPPQNKKLLHLEKLFWFINYKPIILKPYRRQCGQLYWPIPKRYKKQDVFCFLVNHIEFYLACP